MARIAGINVPPQKHAVIALTSIYGIGRTTAEKICDASGVKPDWSNCVPQHRKNMVRVTHGNRGGDFDQFVTIPGSTSVRLPLLKLSFHQESVQAMFKHHAITPDFRHYRTAR